MSTGVITTIAGTGSQGYSGDSGMATSVLFNFPIAISVDSTGLQTYYFICIPLLHD